MHALDVLGDPVRRRILELLVDSGASGAPELGAGEIGEVVQQEFGISQPAVSQHLRVLREHGFATVRAEGRRRLYAVDARGPREASDWLTPFERFWLPKLDALGTELARGKLQRRRAAARPSAAENPDFAAAAESHHPSAAEEPEPSVAENHDLAATAPTTADPASDTPSGARTTTQKET